MRYVLVCIFCLSPVITNAAVVISEVAWMGGDSSANDEWIELQNTGSSQSVDGWSISDGMNLEIALSGVIATDAYAVLERTDESSAPGAAFLLYAGALPNTGATLQLRDQQGTLIDQVAGGEDWEIIGGDNVTKETAQLTPGGWVTGVATPGAPNVTEVVAIENEAETTSQPDPPSVSTAPVPTKKTKVTSLTIPDTELRLSLEAPTIAYVQQPVIFEIEATGLGYNLLRSLMFDWNFGDLGRGYGRVATHTYQYPGTYVVTVTGKYKRHGANIQHEITVLPMNISITRDRHGNVQLHNDSRYQINISGFTVRGRETVTVPDNTWLLAGATLTIPERLLKAQDQIVTVHDPTATLVSYQSPWSVVTETVTDTPVVETPPIIAATGSTVSLLATTGRVLGTSSAASGTAPKRAWSEATTSPPAPTNTPTSYLPYLGLAGLLLISMSGVVLRNS